MDLGDEFDLEHFVFTERRCRSAARQKNSPQIFIKLERAVVHLHTPTNVRSVQRKGFLKLENLRNKYTGNIQTGDCSCMVSPLKKVYSLNISRQFWILLGVKDAAQLSISWNCSQGS